MAATNDFQLFATSIPAYVLSTTDYETDSERLIGHQPGIARASFANKAARQASVMACLIGQFICDLTEEDAVDDGTIDALLANFKAAIINQAFESGTRMWFDQDVAPTYWTIDDSIEDCVIAVKGGSEAYDVSGGTQAGDWTIAGHSHGIDDHNHQWYNYVNPNNSAQSFDENGDATNITYDGSSGPGTQIKADLAGAAGVNNLNLDLYTDPSGVTTTEATEDDATWRPLAQVGIIAQKD